MGVLKPESFENGGLENQGISILIEFLSFLAIQDSNSYLEDTFYNDLQRIDYRFSTWSKVAACRVEVKWVWTQSYFKTNKTNGTFDIFCSIRIPLLGRKSIVLNGKFKHKQKNSDSDLERRDQWVNIEKQELQIPDASIL